MKKLFKRLRLKLGYFTRKELRDFALDMMPKHDIEKDFTIWHADIENFIEDLKQ